MKSVLGSIGPRSVWYYFEEISKIPRCSRNRRGISEYLLGFAKDNDLKHRTDKVGNVVITKPPASGYENKPVVVLQSHTDMVCEKNEKSAHDFEKHPLVLKMEGGWVRAEDTTLGADNGIGMAAMLAILENRYQNFAAGPLECLFTVDEEVGLNGAFGISPDILTGRILINLDSEEAGTLYVGCAGGRDTLLVFPLSKEAVRHGMRVFQLKVRGLKGGHSGVDIHRERANALQLMSRLLFHLKKSFAFSLVSIDGGDKSNAIPREAFSVIAVSGDGVSDIDIKDRLRAFCESLKREYGAVEPGCECEMSETSLPTEVLTEESARRLVGFLMALPHGVVSMSPVIEGLVETSTNLASVKTEGNSVYITCSHRSSVDSALEWVSDTHLALAEAFGAAVTQNEGYPGWAPDPGSKLLKQAREAVFRITGREAEVKAIHAGLECGILKTRFKGMDAVSLGPTILGAHSPDERVNIESVRIFFDILNELLIIIYQD
jgi:dipeptidase D